MITIQYNPIVWWVIPLVITLLSGSVASLVPTNGGVIGNMLGRLFFWFIALVVISITWIIAAVCK